jgi:hypothetical protein
MTLRGIALSLSLAVASSSLIAQTSNTITLRMLEAKSGRLIATSHYLIRADHDKTLHADWVEQNENGTGKLRLWSYIRDISVQATYDNAMEVFINCDTATQKGVSFDHWYSVSTILATGIVAPNGCAKPSSPSKKKAATDILPVAKPGEFIFFVRKQNRLEQAED